MTLISLPYDLIDFPKQNSEKLCSDMDITSTLSCTHTLTHLCSMGQDCPSFLSPDSEGGTSQLAHSRPGSQRQPRCPSGSCCHLCGQTLETLDPYISLALGTRTNTQQISLCVNAETFTLLIHYSSINLININLSAYAYLCSSCHLHCRGEYRRTRRSRPCSDRWRDHHSQIPERTHPHLNTRAN